MLAGMLGVPVFTGGAAIGGACLAAALARARSSRPELVSSQTAFHKAVLSRCPTLTNVYKLMPLLFGNGWVALCLCGQLCSISDARGIPHTLGGWLRHLETVLASRLRNSPVLEYDRDLLQLPDGGTVALDFESLKQVSLLSAVRANTLAVVLLQAWLTSPPCAQDLPADAPVVILLPGLTGGSHDTCALSPKACAACLAPPFTAGPSSSACQSWRPYRSMRRLEALAHSTRYVKHMVHDARQHGLRAVVFNSRGTSDGPVTTPQFYSASYTGDMRAVVAAVQQRWPRSALLAAGWSLGGAL